MGLCASPLPEWWAQLYSKDWSIGIWNDIRHQSLSTCNCLELCHFRFYVVINVFQITIVTIPELWTRDSRLDANDSSSLVYIDDCPSGSTFARDGQTTDGQTSWGANVFPVTGKRLEGQSSRYRRVCIILKFIVVLRSAADHRHVEIWK